MKKLLVSLVFLSGCSDKTELVNEWINDRLSLNVQGFYCPKTLTPLEPTKCSVFFLDKNDRFQQVDLICQDKCQMYSIGEK